MDIKPWDLLNPNDFQSLWWRKSLLLDVHQASIQKSLKDSLAHIIIQDANMGGNFWHFSSWYINDPNRYSCMYYFQNWPFNKQLTEMTHDDIIYLNEYPEVKFTVHYCIFSTEEQRNFCKILERIMD